MSGDNRLRYKKRLSAKHAVLAVLTALMATLVLAPTAQGTFTRYDRTSAPAEPMPNAYQTVDAPGGTTELRLMTLAMGDAASPLSHTETFSTVYRKGVIFVSDALAAEAVPIGNWTVHNHAEESASSANAYLRWYIYRWTSGDAFGNAIAGPSEYATELGLSDAAYEYTWTDRPAVTFNAGDKLVVEVYFRATGTSTRTATLYWGKTTPGTPTASDDDGWVSGPGSNVPTLGWPLLLIAISFFVFFMIKKGKLSARLKPAAIALLLIMALGTRLTMPAKNPVLRPLHSTSAFSVTAPNGRTYDLNPITADSVKAAPDATQLGGTAR